MDQKNHKYTNQLIHEASPYLQQHAHNPVNWFPWGEEAIAKARREDKPIFLSIGYSTCHWCHVMEKETFENEELAPLFNDHFICIKVDREERPDLDHVYMNFTQALTGQGGWPMNVFLTPDLKPFYAATYIPPASRGYSPGIPDVLNGIRDAYRNNREGVDKITQELLARVKEEEERLRQERSVMNEGVVDDLAENLSLRFDPSYHGFGSSPKFPTPQNLIFLLNYSRMKGKSGTANDQTPFSMAKDTIESMYRGGIYDHVGGGLSRYSVDQYWLVPHFEKMLYDNALYMEVLALAFEQEPLPMFSTVYYKTLRYLKDVMRSPGDLFYSAEDADSEGHEGKFYVFSDAEIDEVLGEQAEFKRIFNVTAKGNFEGKNILNLIKSPVDVTSGEERKFNLQLEKLYAYRSVRIRPHLDDKILFSWNAMLVRALAKGSTVFSDPELLQQAEITMATLLDKMAPDGQIHTSRRDAIMGPLGILEDYAYGAWALLALYEATQTDRYLLQAMEVTDQAVSLFWDEAGHGFFLSRKDNEDLIMNPVEPYDSATPSGNSIMAHVLADLALYTHEMRYKDLAEKQFDRFSGALTKLPEAVVSMVDAYARLELDAEVAIVTGKDLAGIRKRIKNQDLPYRVQLLPRKSALRQLEFLSSLDQSDDVFLYSCKRGQCSLPKKLS